MRTFVALVAVTLSACASDAPKEPVADALAPARAELDAGRPRDALSLLYDVVAAKPDDASAWLLCGQTCLTVAASDSQPDFYYVDASNAFEKAIALGAGVDALVGASRALRLAAQPRMALDFARRALEVSAPPSADSLRAAAEAAFDCFVLDKQSGDDAAPMFDASETALQALLQRDARDVWALTQLASLYQRDGRNDGAVEILGRALHAQPDDEALHGRFSALLRSVEGPESVIAFYERFRVKHPECALGAWFEAQEHFEQALAHFDAQADAQPTFARAEQLYAACRKAKPDYERACLGYEVMCRAGTGWSSLAHDDLVGAERAFRSTEELFAGAMDWQLEGRVQSSVTGLQFVADRALRTGNGEFDPLGSRAAAEIYALLHAHRPEDANFANNCGFFHREWGVTTLTRAREDRARAASSSDGALRELNLALAERGERSAREILVVSRDAYLDAARLAPNDVRIVNDAGLILLYHFPSRVDEAERLLLYAVDQGVRQKDSRQIDEDARATLLEAWGDAYQNLGVLHLLTRKDPATAKGWFEQCRQIESNADRAWIRQVALPMCDAALAGKPVDPEQLDPRIWSAE